MTLLVPPSQMLASLERTAQRRSRLVLRLIRAQEDPVKHRLRNYLLAQTDDRLKESLGFSEDDILELRGGQCPLPKDRQNGAV
jgi:hypothetical protein